LSGTGSDDVATAPDGPLHGPSEREQQLAWIRRDIAVTAFGVDEHPTISFRTNGIRPGADETEWKVDGELTIRGVTQPVTVGVEFLGGAIDPWGNKASPRGRPTSFDARLEIATAATGQQLSQR
jgi:hypothetical protein